MLWVNAEPCRCLRGWLIAFRSDAKLRSGELQRVQAILTHDHLKSDIRLRIGDKEQPGKQKVTSQSIQKHTCLQAGSRKGSFSAQKAAGIRRLAYTIDPFYSQNFVSRKGGKDQINEVGG